MPCTYVLEYSLFVCCLSVPLSVLFQDCATALWFNTNRETNEAAREKKCATGTPLTVTISEAAASMRTSSYHRTSLPWPEAWSARASELSVLLGIHFRIVLPPHAVWTRPDAARRAAGW